MNKKNIAITIALLELIAALPLYGIYTGLYTTVTSIGTTEPAVVILNLLGILFITLPILGIYGILKEKAFGFLAITIFPVVAFIYGVTAIPFVKYLYGQDINFNTFIIVVINSLVVIAGLWLLFTRNKSPNNTFKRDAKQHAPLN